MAVIQKDRLPVLTLPPQLWPRVLPPASCQSWSLNNYTVIQDHGTDLIWDLHLLGYVFCLHLKMHIHTVSSTDFTHGSWDIVKLHPLFEWGMRDLSKNVVGNSTPVVLQYRGKMKRCSGTNPQPAPSPASLLLLPPHSLLFNSELTCNISAIKTFKYLPEVQFSN